MLFKNSWFCMVAYCRLLQYITSRSFQNSALFSSSDKSHFV